MIVAKKDSALRAGRGGEAASLTLINVRRRQVADAAPSRTDLTAPALPVAVAPAPAPAPAAARQPASPPPTPEPPQALPETPFGFSARTEPSGAPAAPDQPPPAPPPEAPPAPVASPYGLGASTQRPEPLQPPPVQIPAPQPVATLVARAATAIATAELPRPAAPAVETPPVYDDLPTREALIDYWDELRGDEDRPQIVTLDRRRVAVTWSDSLMVSYQSGDAGMPQMTRFGRLTGDVQYTSMVTEWIISCSRKVSRIGAAMETEQNFPCDRGNRTYRMLLLPFDSAPAGASDHVLCNLSVVR